MTTKFPQLASGSLPPIYRFGGMMRRPGDPNVANYFAMPLLHTTTLRFLAMHGAHKYKNEAARLLLVVGPPGTGKSQGVLAAALSAGYHAAVVPPNLFASDTENGATAALDDFMAEMERYSADHQVPVLAVLEDVDTTILARDDKTSVTPGHRMLAGRIQYIADHRQLFQNHNGTTIGLVCTANRPDELRNSLFRDMRAIWHEHNPAPEAVYDIVFQMLDPRTVDERKFLERLFARHKTENLSFWKALKQDIDAAQLNDLLGEGMPNPATIDAVLAKRRPLDPTTVSALAQRRSANRARNYFSRLR